jgi:hypothetical protein
MGRMRALAPRVLALVLLTPLVLCSPVDGAGQPLPSSPPAAVGFAPERLARLHARLEQMVDEGKHAGLITLIARHGKVVDSQAYGFRDREQRLPMQRDTIVRIYSMTKIVTSVAALMLVEEGRLHDQRPERAVAAGDAGLDGLWPRDVGEDCGDSARQALAVQSAGHVHGILDHGERRDRVRQPFPM